MSEILKSARCAFFEDINSLRFIRNLQYIIYINLVIMAGQNYKKQYDKNLNYF